MNELFNLAKKHKAWKLTENTKHYTIIYDQYLGDQRKKVNNILEIGVKHGGSMRMWEEYFPNAQIHGVDVNEHCKNHESTNIKIHIGNQLDENFLKSLEQFGPFDMIIDDGGHTMKQQLTSLNFLFGFVKMNGVYVIEDLHTSYWKRYGGGLRKEGTTIEKLKQVIDEINYKSSKQAGLLITSMHIYESICFLFKKSFDPGFCGIKLL